jgi:hypothetical protein
MSTMLNQLSARRSFQCDQFHRMEQYLETFDEQVNSKIANGWDSFFEELKINEEPTLVQELYLKMQSQAAFVDNPNFLFSSFILIWYAFVENELVELCELSHTHMNLQKRYQNMYGHSTLEKIRLYFSNEIGIVCHSPHWDALQQLCKFRNKIAHTGQRFSKKLADYNNLPYLKKLIHDFHLTQEIPFKIIVLNKPFCEELLHFSLHFLLNIISELIVLIDK